MSFAVGESFAYERVTIMSLALGESPAQFLIRMSF